MKIIHGKEEETLTSNTGNKIIIILDKGIDHNKLLRHNNLAKKLEHFMYLKTYPQYREKGFAVTPLFGKRPLIDGWQETTAQEPYVHTTYETKNGKHINLKTANIGLLCGEPSGVICIDIDTDDETLVQMILDSLPETPVMKKGKKGVNFFYRYNGESTNNYKNPLSKKDVLFELISTGRQTVLPPSIHPDTKKPYEWCNRDGSSTHTSLLDVEKDDLPFLPKNWLADLDVQITKYFQDKLPNNIGGGVAGLLTASDVGKVDHTQMADYRPKSIDEIPEGYKDRCRSGAHTVIAEKLMSFINRKFSPEKAVREILKFDKEYNQGYVSTYYECKTCKFRAGSPQERASMHYTDLLSTVTKKKVADGEAIPLPKGGNGSNLLKEMEVVLLLIQKFNISYDPETTLINVDHSDFIQQDGDIYKYTYDGRWQLLDEHNIKSIKRIISKFYNGDATNTKIEGTFRMFLNHIPGPPEGIDMKIPRGDRLVLANCTFHVVSTESGYRLERHEHSRQDYATNRINLPYEDGTEENDAFNEMLENIFKGDKDAHEKKMAIAELYGAALMPIFPKIFFLHGKAGCGKSTVFITLNNLLSGDNVGSVDPGDFRGFLIEPLIGKMVNIVTDIRSNTAIEASVLKQIEDRMPFTIQRKGKQNIRAPLPAVHGFGANDLPKNFDSSAKAFGRRVIFIGFHNVMSRRDSNGQYTHDRNFGNRVFNANPQGVLNFAIKGIERLCNHNGQYTQPESGFQTLDAWQSEYNVADQFYFDLEAGEVEGIGSYVPVLSEEEKVKRTDLWEVFKKWMTDTNRGRQKITKQAFYKLMNDRFETVKSGGSWYFKGIGEKVLGSCDSGESTVDSAQY